MKEEFMFQIQPLRARETTPAPHKVCTPDSSKYTDVSSLAKYQSHKWKAGQ